MKDKRFCLRLKASELENLNEASQYFEMTASEFLRMSIEAGINTMYQEQIKNDIPVIQKAIDEKLLHFKNNMKNKNLN